jgi:cytidylate kinase
MSERTKIITIDGPAASGKGTVARALAESLGYAYIDTGALYRLTAKACLDQQIDPKDEAGAANMASLIKEGLSVDDFSSPALRTEDVARGASIVAAHPKVRAALLDVQKDLAKNPPLLSDGTQARGSVLDGRDTGTVVCPDADLKLFITAKTEIRAERRYKELQLKGFQDTYKAVLQDMIERDERDQGRDTAPLKPADDAILIDTSDLDAAQVLDQAKEFAKKL